MFIDKVTLKDFRIYKGINEVTFLHHVDKNVTIIAGNNGYGKTTFLTSLVWCLYGKLMVDVDERFRREIYESGGYKRFCKKSINRAIWNCSKKEELNQKIPLARDRDIEILKREINSLNTYYVSIVISDIFIPSVPCSKVEIIRKFNAETEHESIEILIDGRENELTKEVGPEIFIHDFIMPKEIAKFFFFDAEKIVSLAEIRSIEEKRELSRAYTEVLGIKKYEDLKRNLENIRFRLRSNKVNEEDSIQLGIITKNIKHTKKLQSHYRDILESNREEFARRRVEIGKLQEKLIREGSSISYDEFNDLKLLKENAAYEFRTANSKFKEFLDLAPFAIIRNKLEHISKYLILEEEQQAANHSTEFFQAKIRAINQEIKNQNDDLNLPDKTICKINNILRSHLMTAGNNNFKPLLDFNLEQSNRFKALVDNINNSYYDRFKILVKDLKLKQSSLAILVNKLSDAETKEGDLIIKEIRKEKLKLEAQLQKLEDEIVHIRVKLESTINECKILQKRQSELSKKVKVAHNDLRKDKISGRLINELNIFLLKLKSKKKESLEVKILSELQTLMHKEDFISKVEVVVKDDILDIEFYDNQDYLINKDGLSKGEQQLYATALLKALVDESNIKFPIFIDSPLQKFDQIHAQNIIRDFYPSISEQVILLPLLEKELTKKEYQSLHPKVSKTYLIQNFDKDRSGFKECNSSELFNRKNANV